MERVYEILNDKWKEACRIILGGEIGELKDYEGWLSEYAYNNAIPRDGLWIPPEYKDAKRILPYEQLSAPKRFEPLSINEIKDIDSIIQAIQEGSEVQHIQDRAN